MLRSKLLSTYYEKVYNLRNGAKGDKEYSDIKTFFDTFMLLYTSRYTGHLSSVSCIEGLHSDDTDRLVYNKMMEEFSILAFYIDRRAEGLLAMDRLMISPKSTVNMHQAIGNIPYYIDTLPPEVIKMKKQLKFGNIHHDFVHMNF